MSSLCSEAPQRRPNILFIVADDLGWNDVSWHNPNIHSPRLEELASQGVKLNQYYVQPTCTPSRVAFMTGKYPYRVGRQHSYIKPLSPAGLPTDVDIMPQFFKKAGYQTHAIGKWHLGFCHQNYTPTYRGFDSFYGFYNGAEGYYSHTKWASGPSGPVEGYDFRFNEMILIGPEVSGKYSADLFVNRAQALFEHFAFEKELGKDSPWFTYLSFQSVHEPLQVPHEYTENVCQYKSWARHYYSAMVSSLDDAVDQVVSSLKETGQYSDTLIVFTTDNGGAVKFGGSNLPLRGTKGTMYEGGTRGVAFMHSPLLHRTGYESNSLMHATDWLPTFMEAIGEGELLREAALDGVSQWGALSSGKGGSYSAREELVYNIKEKPFMAALRYRDYKLVWGSRTKKDVWFSAEEQPLDEGECKAVRQRRTNFTTPSHKSRSSLRGVETIEEFDLDTDTDAEYWDEDNLEEDDEDDDNALSRSIYRQGRKRKEMWKAAKKRWKSGKRSGLRRKRNKKRNRSKIKGFSKLKERKKSLLKNINGVEIKPFGQALLYNVKNDPEERNEVSADFPHIVERLKNHVKRHFEELQPTFSPQEDFANGNPVRWGGFWSPGWCKPHTVRSQNIEIFFKN